MSRKCWHVSWVPSIALAALGISFSLLGVANASAANINFKESFGSAAEPSFVKPTGLTVDQGSGDLLVVDVEAKTISRFNSDGTPDEFSAVGTNVIDGKEGVDQTPEEGFDFAAGNPRQVQIAVDNSGPLSSTDGNIYVSQFAKFLIDIFAEDGTYLGQLTASSEGPLGFTPGVAVDSAGAVYVSDFVSAGRIHKYVPAGSFPVNSDNTANFPHPSFGRLAAGAGSTAGFIFASESGEVVSKLDRATGEIKYVVDPGSSVTIAVDSAGGQLFNATESMVKEYDASGPTEAQLVGGFSPGNGIRGIAIDGATGNVYVARLASPKIEVWERVTVPDPVTKAASAVAESGATLNGEVNPNGAPLTACFFEWGTTTAYGEITDCEEPGFEEVGEGSSPVPVHADIKELRAGTTYHFRLVAENAQGASEGEDKELQTLGPSLKEQAASQVTANGAKISTELNPNSEDSGFFVEYLDEAAYLANPPSERFLGATPVPDPEGKVPAVVSGAGNLKAGSAIVSLLSTSAGTLGPGQAISGPGIPTETEILSVLTPTELELSNPATATIEAAALSAIGFQPIAQQLSGLAPQTTYYFRVVASNPAGTALGPDMSFTTFALPGTTPLPDGRVYEMVTPSQKTGEVIPPEPNGDLSGSCGECLPGEPLNTMPMQAAPDGESVLYEGQPFSGGLASGPNEYVSTRGSDEWGTASLSTPAITGRYEAFSSDLSLGVLFQRDPALSPEAPSRGSEAFPNLYLRSKGGSFEPLVTVEPSQRQPFEFRITYAGANSGAPLTPEFSHLVFEANDALSEEAPEVGAGDCTFGLSECNLYEWVEGELRLINVLPDESTPTSAVIGSGRLLATGPLPYEAPNVDRAISANGTKIFWSEPKSGQVYVRINGEETLEIPGPGSCKESVTLTDRACFLTASTDAAKVLLANGQLFEFDEEAEAYEEAADLTAGQGGFEGILGASENLEQIYFLDIADLTGGEENSNGEEAEVGKLNLYAWDEEATSFIGALLASDNSLPLQSRYGAWKAARPDRTAQVSPKGTRLAFMSRAALSGYDNDVSGGGECRVGGGPACLEVFVYFADSETLSCVSCNPSGQRPIGPSNLSLLRPGRPGAIGYPPYPQPGNLVEEGEGRVFFESQDVLLPQDTNGTVQDVYEWVPDGMGSCEQAKGCVHLISSGHAVNDSMFLDSTPSGNDIFFITRERLVARDRDDQLDLYDARAGGGFKETPPEICVGDACKGAISAPPLQPSASPGFIGPPNPPAKPRCKKGFVKKGGKCLKKKKQGQGGRKRGGSR
jgi:hypothetical protein